MIISPLYKNGRENILRGVVFSMLIRRKITLDLSFIVQNPMISSVESKAWST